MIDIRGLTDEELDDLIEQAVELRTQRRALVSAPIYIESNARAFLDARDGPYDPASPPVWVDPSSPQGMIYPLDWRTTWPEGGPVYRSIHPANVWEPGTEHGHAWVREDPDPGPDEYIAWAIAQVVKVGDKRTHHGRLWEARVNHTTHAGWEPSAASYAVWTDLGPYPAV